MRIGRYLLPNPVILAPMAGVTDQPFRTLCTRLGAGMTVSEMVTANNALWGSRKSSKRLDHGGELGLRAVQIAGSEPAMMAEAARLNVERGAEIIDINMGCPAKKVCRKAAGSALLRDEPLVQRILEAVVDAVAVPVTLKIRTGWDTQSRNAVRIATIAEAAGIKALAIHGRTRACGYGGHAEYHTIRAVKAAIGIPVIANGDIAEPEQAARVLESTGADAVMIGRAAQGRPWLLGAIARYLANGARSPEPTPAQVREMLLDHLRALYAFHGEYTGVRMARKHIAWYVRGYRDSATLRAAANAATSATEQQALVEAFFFDPAVAA